VLRTDCTPKRRSRHAGWILTLASACAAEPNYTPPPPPTPDAGFPPEPDRIGAPLSLYLEPVVSRPADLAIELEDGAILTAGALGLALVDTGTVTALGDDPGPIRAATPLPNGALVSGARGLYVLSAGQLQVSPLDAQLPGAPLSLLTVPGRAGLEVWMAGDGWLWLWRGDQLSDVRPGALPLSAPKLAYGAAAGGRSAVWVAAGGALYALVVEDQVTRAYPENLTAPVRQLAVDARRTLWVVDDAGKLRSRRADDVWRDHDAVAGVRSVHASLRSDEVWIETMTEMWRYDQTEFRKVNNLPAGRVLSSASQGSVLMGDQDGLAQVYGQRAVRLTGLKEGGLLLSSAAIQVRPVAAANVTTVTATLDDQAISVSPSPWNITLDPALIDDGAHRLEVRVAYSDGESATGTLRFSHYEGPPPSWQADIAPLFRDRCELCHGARGSARILDTPALWSAEIDSILLNLRTRRMPLPPSAPLTEAELGLVEGWQAAGFPAQ
jgi:hypothetical protein